MLKLILQQNKNSFHLLITTLLTSICSTRHRGELINNTNILQNPNINKNVLVDNLIHSKNKNLDSFNGDQ